MTRKQVFFASEFRRLRQFFSAKVHSLDLLFCQKGDHILLLNGWDYMREVKESQEVARFRDEPRKRAGCVFAQRTSLRAGSKPTDVLPRPPSVDGSTLLAEENIVGEHNSKTDIIVEVVWVVPVTNRTTRVVSIVVPGAAAHYTLSWLVPFSYSIFSIPPAVFRFQLAYWKHAHTDSI